MGIHQLSKVIEENCPDAIKTGDIKSYSGCKIAIDASLSIYQFLIAVRAEGNTLVNDDNETTSHLMGIFYRTLRMIDNGIKPFYVFDGKPPNLKGGELLKRKEKRDDAEEKKKLAIETGDTETIEKMSRRLVKVTPEHNNQCKELLTVMGIPYIQAPCEAEAQCSVMVKADKAFGVGTEDMDALTFGGTKLLRKLTCSETKKVPIQEFHLDRILRGMEFTMDQFIDMCILLGCDYCDTIRGIGPKKAVELIRKHKTIETILENIDTTKYIVPVDWNYKGARILFQNPEVEDPETVDLKWTMPDEEGIVELMCKKNNFSEDRIRTAVKRLVKARSTTTQHRIDSFFTVTPAAKPLKRAADKKDDKKNPKKAKSVNSKFGRAK